MLDASPKQLCSSDVPWQSGSALFYGPDDCVQRCRAEVLDLLDFEYILRRLWLAHELMGTGFLHVDDFLNASDPSALLYAPKRLD
jgi:hypothetical protein